MLEFVVMNLWETIVGEICERLALEAAWVRVKFMTPDPYGIVCPIETDTDFQRMRHIYHTLKKLVVDIIVEEVNGSADGNSASLLPL